MRVMEKTKKTSLRRCYLQILGALVVSLSVHFSHADADRERASLARIAHELQAIDPLITDAKSQANLDARIQFNYDWLQQDLDRVRLGIQAHIDAPRSEPRTFPPLRGDYRQ